MPEHHEESCELYESEEDFDVVFPSGYEAAVVLHPGEEQFHHLL